MTNTKTRSALGVVDQAKECMTVPIVKNATVQVLGQ